MLSHGAECNMGNIFRVFHILQLIYNSINMKNEENICQYRMRQREINYFIVKCLFYLNKIYQESSYLRIVSGLLNII